MKVFIAGIDGYLGWSLALYLSSRGHDVSGCDNFARRRNVEKMGSLSVIPVPFEKRRKAFKQKYGKFDFYEIDLLHYVDLVNTIRQIKPDTIVHLAEQPSAPFSMDGVINAVYTQKNNVIGTLNLLYAMKKYCPEAHLLKLGTMGEYGTPPCDIPEGFFDETATFRGKSLNGLPFPRQAASWYHQSKVHDSNNIQFACKNWGIRSTDVMQGVVYGTRIEEMDDETLMTRFDIDEAFGTAINRFCASAVIGEPITVYGAGHQVRGFLPLKDSMQCLTIAVENPPGKGEYRVFNQFEEIYDLTELAKKVKATAKDFGLDVKIYNYQNPRLEMEEHYYNPDHQKLLDLGYKPTHDMESELRQMFRDLIKFKSRIEKVKDVLVPSIQWDNTKRRSEPIGEVE